MTKDFSALLAFLEQQTGLPENEWTQLPLSPFGLMEALWPMNDVFRPKVIRLKTIRYNSRFEAQADEAVLDFARSLNTKSWESLTSGAWRVLIERHLQMLLVCSANAAANEPVMWTVPHALPKTAYTAAAVLEWWLGMKLLWPPRFSAGLELPEATSQGPIQLQ